MGNSIFLILLTCILNFLQCTFIAFIIKVYFYLKKKHKAIGFEVICTEVTDREENGPQDQALGKRRESVCHSYLGNSSTVAACGMAPRSEQLEGRVTNI